MKNWIRLQVTHINIVTFCFDFWMFPNQKPANVGEEKASSRIMRVSVCLRILMVHAVITSPIYHWILEEMKNRLINLNNIIFLIEYIRLTRAQNTILLLENIH